MFRVSPTRQRLGSGPVTWSDSCVLTNNIKRRKEGRKERKKEGGRKEGKKERKKGRKEGKSELIHPPFGFTLATKNDLWIEKHRIYINEREIEVQSGGNPCQRAKATYLNASCIIPLNLYSNSGFSYYRI